MIYADSSAVVSAYLSDEPEHGRWRALVFDGTEPVVTSELTRVEVASAFASAARDRRIPAAQPFVASFEADCAEGGPIQLIAFRPEPAVARAARLVQEYPLLALDAIQLAVALEQALPLAAGEPIAFLTADRRQEAAALKLGFRDPTDPGFLEAMAGLADPDGGDFLRSDDLPGQEPDSAS